MIVDKLRTLARRHLPRPLVELLRGRGEGVRFLASPDALRRWRILGRFQAVSDGIECTQSEPETLQVARGLMGLRTTVPGVFVECGCYKGGATAKLSIVARELDRRLVVFDSFAGLPAEDGTADPMYRNWMNGSPVAFHAGSYDSRLDETRDNVARCGEGDVVDYVQGFFDDSMPGWDGQVAAIVLDVDLVSSTRTCLKHLWPRLSPGGLLYSQDAHLAEIVDLFRDAAFWRELGEPTPPVFEGLGQQKMVMARKRAG